ncbi:hypothetical protein ACHMW7_28380 [Aminobacter sp. UC22_36]|uniref:hypothetical protein n=1 Tax=Aminobacter sp. UC22_36 TaxID=3374549 RepID=UPI003757C222
MHGTLPAIRRMRVVRRDDSWTYIESEVLKEFWPSIEVIRKRLPHRTERAIRNMAKRCGLIPDKAQHIWTAGQDRTLKRMAASGATRKEIADTLGLTALQVASRLQYTKTHIAKRAPVMLGDPLVDAVRRRAFDLKISMVDLDRSLGRHKVFQNAWKQKLVGPIHLHKAVKALGGSLVVQWEEE